MLSPLEGWISPMTHLRFYIFEFAVEHPPENVFGFVLQNKWFRIAQLLGVSAYSANAKVQQVHLFEASVDLCERQSFENVVADEQNLKPIGLKQAPRRKRVNLLSGSFSRPSWRKRLWIDSHRLSPSVSLGCEGITQGFELIFSKKKLFLLMSSKLETPMNV